MPHFWAELLERPMERKRERERNEWFVFFSSCLVHLWYTFLLHRVFVHPITAPNFAVKQFCTLLLAHGTSDKLDPNHSKFQARIDKSPFFAYDELSMGTILDSLIFIVCSIIITGNPLCGGLSELFWNLCWHCTTVSANLHFFGETPIGFNNSCSISVISS